MNFFQFQGNNLYIKFLKKLINKNQLRDILHLKIQSQYKVFLINQKDHLQGNQSFKDKQKYKYFQISQLFPLFLCQGEIMRFQAGINDGQISNIIIRFQIVYIIAVKNPQLQKQ
ncbi:hypothetical protein pb186bvf_020378 [Paramecium bursaria]